MSNTINIDHVVDCNLRIIEGLMNPPEVQVRSTEVIPTLLAALSRDQMHTKPGCTPIEPVPASKLEHFAQKILVETNMEDLLRKMVNNQKRIAELLELPRTAQTYANLKARVEHGDALCKVLHLQTSANCSTQLIWHLRKETDTEFETDVE